MNINSSPKSLPSHNEHNSMRYHSFLNKEDAVWGEQQVVRFRWILIIAILVLIGYIFYEGNTERAIYSLLLSMCYIGYNSAISYLIKKHSQTTWVGYVSSFIDVTILSAHIFNYSYFFTPIAVSTAASLFLYGVLIMLSVLRYDGKLVIFTTIYVVICYNVVYFLRYPHIDPQLIDQIASGGPEGVMYRSVYFILMGYFIFSIPKMINRLVERQNKVNNERRDIEIQLALETQRRELATNKLKVEQQFNNQLNKQKLIIEQQNSSLEKAIATRDKLFSIIGHDLRSPFCLQASLSEYLIYDFHSLDQEVLLDSIYAINKTSNDGLGLLSNLIDWSKSQSNLLESKPTQVNVKKAVDHVVYLQSETARSKNIEVKNMVGPEFCVKTDEQMFVTVIRNLLSNAIKFTLNDGQVSFNCFYEDENCIVQVTDNGIGMSSAQIDKVFNDSNYSSTLGTNLEQGTGIGLGLCKDMIESNKGTISAISEIGQGTTIQLKLPKLKC
ncbi:sensor histidine kinase [Saccharicrinis aurantiacus]|uniref:sensor histidine kinase n=1 Tax=Saccharicrinis aurantiacus TaxID=1849719 RepID=UPI0015C559C6|nr:HAMP domain-containing sensor histidine kinase [Saccharicrinis aurantiacus]